MVTARHINHSTDIDTQHDSSGGRLVDADGRTLPLRSTSLHTVAKAGLARTVLVQQFVNSHDAPLLVSYLLPLPADGAVSGFSFRIGDKRIVGEIDRKQKARERFEEAIASGRTAAILEQERSSLFQQEVGNIPPHEEVICEVIIDQPLIWISSGAWEFRFPTVVGPRYMGAPGRVKDAAKITVDVADRELETRATLALDIGDTLSEGKRPESPSHPLSVVADEFGNRVTFAKARGASLDRDVVIRWPVAKAKVGLALESARPSSEAHDGNSFGLLTIVPPRPDAERKPVPRDLIVLVDTSGSMGGQPLNQAKRVVCALIDSLEDRDRLELIEFSDRPHRWQKEPVVATRDGKKSATKWVKSLSAGGGTEMRAGILEALRPLRSGAQRQVLLITDGYIGFEREILETIVDRLPNSCRLHTLGVGSSVNRSLTGPAARAGAGVEVIIGLGEDAERAISRLMKRTAMPLVTELEISGDAVETTVPLRLPDLYADSPALIGVQLAKEGGTLCVKGVVADGSFEHRITADSLSLGDGNQAVVALYGREWVEDLETRLAAGGDKNEIDRQIERIGLDFQISTRLTSWVAIGEDVIEGEGELIEESMPHELPYGTAIEGFGLRAADIPEYAPPPTMASMPAPGMPVAPRNRVSRAPAPSLEEDLDFGEVEEAQARYAASPEQLSGVSVKASRMYQKKNPFVTYLVLLLIIIAIALGIWLIWGPGDAKQEAPTPNRTEQVGEQHP